MLDHTGNSIQMKQISQDPTYLMQLQGECKIDAITPLKLHYYRAVPLLILSIATVIGAIILLNSVKARKFILYSQSDFCDASHFYIESGDQIVDIQPLFMSGNQKCFYFRQLKFVLRGTQYVPMGFPYKSEVANLQLKSGLNDEIFDSNTEKYGLNKHQVEIPSYFRYMFETIFKPLYLLQYVVVLSLFVQGLPIFGIILIVFSMITTSGNYIALFIGKKKIQEISKKDFEVTVIRNGETKEIPCESLIPGDLVKLKKGEKISCDIILCEGTAYLNQSSLTGESVPIRKKACDSLMKVSGSTVTGISAFTKKESEIKSQNWLYDGTTVFECEGAIGICIFTGFTSTKGRILRKILNRVPKTPDFFKNMFFFLLLSFVVSMTLYCATLPIRLNSRINIEIVYLRILDYIVSAVPPAFPIYFTMAYSWSIYRLQKQKIFSTMPQKTVQPNRLATICFDKTGTLTTTKVDLNKVYDMQSIHLKKQFVFQDSDLTKLLFGTCHCIVMIDGVKLGDEIDLQMFEHSGFQFTGNKEGQFKNGKGETVEVLRVNQFESRHQSMSVLIKYNPTNEYYVFVKGAPEKIYTLGGMEIKKFSSFLEDLSFKGLRSIAFAYKKIYPEEVEGYLKATQRDKFLAGVEMLGVVAFENGLKFETVETISNLKECGITSRMITGDSLQIAVEIGYKSGILNQNQPVLLVKGHGNVQISESTWIDKSTYNVVQVSKVSNGKQYSRIQRQMTRSQIQDAKMSIAVDNAFITHHNFILTDNMKVFARILPQNKAKIVNCIKRQFEEMENEKSCCQRIFTTGMNKVGMVGDGANDLLAIKEADVGIGFNGTDAVYSSAFTIQSLDHVISILQQGKCTTRNIIECLRFMMIVNYLNLMVEIFTATQSTFISQTQALIINFLIIVTQPIIMSFSYPASENTKLRVLDNFIRWENQIFVWLDIILLGSALIGSYFYIINTPGFQPNTEPWQLSTGYHPECQLVTSIFLVFGFVLSTVSWLVSFGAPFKRPFYRNYVLIIISIILVVAFTTFFFIIQGGMQFLNLVPLSPANGAVMFGISTGAILLTFIVNLVLHRCLHRETADAKIGHEEYTQIQIN